MMYIIYISGRMVAEIHGTEAAYYAYIKATEIADLTNEVAYLVDGNTGEVIAVSDKVS